jgi:hypothetical protein
MEQTALLFNGATALSRHTSALGAVDAQDRIGRQCLALLTAYREYGPLTDAEAAVRLQVERSTINARRAELRRRRLVDLVDTVTNPETGIRNCRWGLA